MKVLNYLQSFNIKDKNNQNLLEDNLFNGDKIFDKTLKEARGNFEKLYFQFHMQNKLSVTELAKKSGIERTHLYRKLKSLGIKGK